MTALAITSLPFWLLAGVADAAYNITFNRTIYPINPGFEFDVRWATLVANETVNVSSQDASYWKVLMDRPENATRDADTPRVAEPMYLNYFREYFNSSGLEWTTTTLDPGYNLSHFGDERFQASWQGQGGGATAIQAKTAIRGNASIVGTYNNNFTLEIEASAYPPLGSPWTVDNLTITYNMVLEDNHTLQMTEIPRDGPEISQSLPLNTQNETWLANGLADSGMQIGLKGMVNSSAVLVDLPPNLAFVSVLGRRHLTPGAGGECRFVFDPPLAWHQVYSKAIYYTFADTGNPNFASFAYSGQSTSFPNPNDTVAVRDGSLPTVENVHLLNQQLDPTVRYRFAILQGPTGSGIQAGSVNSTYRSSPGACEFSKIQMWQSVSIASEQNNATASDSGSAANDSAVASEAGGSARKAMSGGAIAGTVIGVVVSVLLLVALVFWLWRRRQQRSTDSGVGSIQDDTKATPFVAPVYPAARVGSISKAQRLEEAQQRNAVHGHSESRTSDGENDVDVEVLPPLYRDEWMTEGTRPGAAARGRGRRHRPRGPRKGSAQSRVDPGITTKESDIPGQPVVQGESGPSQLPMTSEERKLLGASETSHDLSPSPPGITPEKMKYL